MSSRKSVFLILFCEVRCRFPIRKENSLSKYQKEHKSDKRLGSLERDLGKSDYSLIEEI